MAKYCPVLNEYVVYLACQDCDRECQKNLHDVPGSEQEDEDLENQKYKCHSTRARAS